VTSINDFVTYCVDNVNKSLLSSHLRTAGNARTVVGESFYATFQVDPSLEERIAKQLGVKLENDAFYSALSHAKQQVERPEFTINVLHKMCTLVENPAFLIIDDATYKSCMDNPHSSLIFNSDKNTVKSDIIGSVVFQDFNLKIVGPQFLADSECAYTSFPTTVIGENTFKYTSEFKLSNISSGEESPTNPIATALTAIRDWRDSTIHKKDSNTAMFDRIKQKQTTVTVLRKIAMDVDTDNMVQLILPEGAPLWLK